MIEKVPVKTDIDHFEAAYILGLTPYAVIHGHIRRGFLDYEKRGSDYYLSSAQVRMYKKARKNRESKLDWIRVMKQ